MLPILIELLALGLCISGAIIGFPPTMTLAFPEGATTADDMESAIRARNRGVLIFIFGAVLGCFGVLLA